LLDTKVLAARGAALWSLGERHLPDVVRPFSALRVSLAARSASGRDDEPGALARLFRAIPEADLHRGLIHPARKAALVLRMAYVQWSDWARLRRVGRTLERFGSYPIPP
jgi:hypothetical protein